MKVSRTSSYVQSQHDLDSNGSKLWMSKEFNCGKVGQLFLTNCSCFIHFHLHRNVLIDGV